MDERMLQGPRGLPGGVMVGEVGRGGRRCAVVWKTAIFEANAILQGPLPGGEPGAPLGGTCLPIGIGPPRTLRVYSWTTSSRTSSR